MATGRRFGLSSGEGYLNSPICQYLIMAIEVLTGQSSMRHLANYSLYWSRAQMQELSGVEGLWGPSQESRALSREAQAQQR